MMAAATCTVLVVALALLSSIRSYCVDGAVDDEFFPLRITDLGNSANVQAAYRQLCGNDPRRGYVAWVRDATEQEQLMASMPNNSANYILGGNRNMGNESVFRWTEGPMGVVDGGLGTPFFNGAIATGGTCLSYCNFGVDEPNNVLGRNEQYVVALENGKWNDVRGTSLQGTSYCACRKKRLTNTVSYSKGSPSATPAPDATFFTVPLTKSITEDLMTACRRGCASSSNGVGFVAWVLSAPESFSLWHVVPIEAHVVVIGGSRTVDGSVYRWTEGPMRLFDHGQGRPFYDGRKSSEGGHCVEGMFCNFNASQPDNAYDGQSQLLLWGPAASSPTTRGKWDDTGPNSTLGENAFCACRRPPTQSASLTRSVSNATDEVFALDVTSSFTPIVGTFFIVPLTRLNASEDLMSACRRGCASSVHGAGFVAWVLNARDNQSLWAIVPYDVHFVVLGGSRTVGGNVYRWTEGPMRLFDNGQGRPFYNGIRARNGGHCVEGMFCDFDTNQPDDAHDGQSQLVLWGPSRTPPTRRGKWDDSGPNSFFSQYPPSASVCGCRRPPTQSESATWERPSASPTPSTERSSTPSTTMFGTRLTLSTSASGDDSWSASTTPSLSTTASPSRTSSRSNTTSKTLSWTSCWQPLTLTLLHGGWPTTSHNPAGSTNTTNEVSAVRLELLRGTTLYISLDAATRIPAPPLEVLHAPTGPWTLRTYVDPSDPSDAPDAAASVATHCALHGSSHNDSNVTAGSTLPPGTEAAAGLVCVTTLRLRRNDSSWTGHLASSSVFVPVLPLALTALCAVERRSVHLLFDVERTEADRTSQAAAVAGTIVAGAAGGDLGAASAMLLLSTLSCDGTVREPLPVAQFLISVFYSHGPIAIAWGNLGLCAAFVILHASVTALVSRRRGEAFAMVAGDVARFPAIGINVVDFWLPGSVLGAVSAMTALDSAGSEIAAGATAVVVVVLLLIGLSVWTVRFVIPRSHWEAYTTYPTSGAWDERLYPEGRWGPKWMRNAYGPLMTSMVFEFGVLTVAQRVVTVLLAAANALQGHTEACEVVLLFLTTSYFALAAVFVVLRPLRLPMNGCVVPMSHCVFGCVCALKYAQASPDAISALQAFHAALQVWRLGWVMWLSYREARWDADTLSERGGHLAWTMANAVWYGSGGIGQEVEATFLHNTTQPKGGAGCALEQGLLDDDLVDAGLLEMTAITTVEGMHPTILPSPPPSLDDAHDDGDASASGATSVDGDRTIVACEDTAIVPLLRESERVDEDDVDAEGNLFGIERYFMQAEPPTLVPEGDGVDESMVALAAEPTNTATEREQALDKRAAELDALVEPCCCDDPLPEAVARSTTPDALQSYGSD